MLHNVPSSQPQCCNYFYATLSFTKIVDDFPRTGSLDGPWVGKHCLRRSDDACCWMAVNSFCFFSRYIYCEKCFNDLRGDDVEMADDPSQPGL